MIEPMSLPEPTATTQTPAKRNVKPCVTALETLPTDPCPRAIDERPTTVDETVDRSVEPAMVG